MCRKGIKAAYRQGCQSHLLVQPQKLAVANPTVQDSIHVNVIGLRIQKQETFQGSSQSYRFENPNRKLAG